jgi:hypothetical protein
MLGMAEGSAPVLPVASRYPSPTPSHPLTLSVCHVCNGSRAYERCCDQCGRKKHVLCSLLQTLSRVRAREAWMTRYKTSSRQPAPKPFPVPHTPSLLSLACHTCLASPLT